MKIEPLKLLTFLLAAVTTKGADCSAGGLELMKGEEEIFTQIKADIQASGKKQTMANFITGEVADYNGDYDLARIGKNAAICTDMNVANGNTVLASQFNEIANRNKDLYDCCERTTGTDKRSTSFVDRVAKNAFQRDL